MRALAVTPLYPPHSLVGSWLTTHEFLAHLAGRGHQVDVIPWCSDQDPVDLDGVHVHAKTAANITALARQADVVICHVGDNGAAARLAAAHQVPVVRMAHSPATRSRLDGAALVVWNSHSLAAAHPWWGGRSIVCHPPIHPDRYRATPGDLVTLVNLSTAKGGGHFWRLAAAMPDTEFFAVRGGHGRQVVRDLPNVEVIDPTNDMAGDVYARTRVLLMPSAVESWGRVAIEAACSGIPTIAHPTPGLREALGDSGLFLPRSSVRQWQAAIRELTTDAEAWAEASTAARARADQLDPTPDLDRFADAVEDLCSGS